MIHTWDPNAGSSKIAFQFPSTGPDGTANYVYNLYFTDTAGTNLEANMNLVSANNASGATVTVTDVQATGDAPPPVLRVAGGDTTDPDTIHPVYILSNEALIYTGMQQLQTYLVKGATKDDPLDQLTKVGYKFMAKAVRPDESRILRLELPSNF